MWTVRTQDLTFLTDDISVSLGQKSFACNNAKYPYWFSIDNKLEESTRVGEYEIYGDPYDSLTGSNQLEGGIFDLVAKVSLKTQP